MEYKKEVTNGKKIISVFTEKHRQIANRLFTRVVLSANDISAQALAQWDTGATNTCISEEVAQTYNLRMRTTGTVEIA